MITYKMEMETAGEHIKMDLKKTDCEKGRQTKLA
jgi:hypothetical protein